MQTKIKNYKLLFFFALLFFVIGCTKEKAIDLNNTNNNINVKEIDKQSTSGNITAGCTVYGSVKEKGTLIPIPGANCVRVSNSVGTSTTVTGAFSITVPVGTADAIDFSFVGYKTLRKSFTASGYFLNMGTIELEPADEE